MQPTSTDNATTLTAALDNVLEVEADIDASAIKSNTFEMEWPPKSEKVQEFPEVDRAEWFDVETAKNKINPAQAELIESMLKKI